MTAVTSVAQVIGRDEDLATIASFLGRFGDGFGLLIIEGDAGMGKTTLWEAALNSAGKEGLHTLRARPIEAESALSFVGLNDLLAGVDESVWQALPGLQRSALEAAVHRREPDPAVGSGVVAISLLSLIRELATQDSVLIAIDDYQWLDRSTARVLEFALRRLDSEPVRMIVTARQPAQGEWRRLVGDDRVIGLTLGPLPPSALYHMIYQRLGVPLGRPTLFRLHETSNGNPFFALELARELAEHHEDDYSGRPLPLPGQLKDLLQRRLGRLPARVRLLLMAIAAMSAPTLDDLLSLTDIGGPGVMADLERAQQAGIVEINGGLVGFSHPMLAAAAYAVATPTARDRIHARLASFVANPEEAARHLALATHRPNEEAATVLAQAAGRANSRGASDVAALLAEHSLRLTPAANRAGRFQRALITGAFTLASGNPSRARQIFERAAAAASAPDERAAALLHQAQLVSPLRHATALCRQALDLATDPALQSRIHRTLGTISYALGDVSAAESHARQAVHLAENSDDFAALGLALAELAHWTFCGGGGYREDLFVKAVALNGSAAATSPRSHYAKITMDAGHLAKARNLLEQLLDEASAEGDLEGVAAHHLHLAQLELWNGNLGTAIEHADESLLLHEYSDQPGAPRHVKAMALACLGEVESAEQEAVRGLAEAESSENLLMTIYNLHVRGFVQLTLDQPAAARPYLDRAIDLHRPRWNHEFGDAHFVPDQVETLIALGDLDQAEELVRWMEEVGAATRRPWTQAAGLRSRGLLAAAQGRQKEAEEALDEAVRQHRSLDMPFELARTLLVQGSLHRRRRQWARATASLREAHGIFRRLNSTLWAVKAAGEMARVGVRSRAQTSLTPVEERVAGLASLGHNNREIADLLFISRKTVEANLTHVYRKLGIRSRAQLGTVLSESGMSSRSN